MTVTKDQAQMIATLAAASRPNGARRWDHAGIMARLRDLAHWSLPELILETITAASDPDAETPGVIGRQGRRWESVRSVVVESAPVGTRCTVCGQRVQNHNNPFGGGHPFSPPRERLPIEAIRAITNPSRAELAPTSGPTERRTLDDLAAANPQLHERLETLRAANPGLRGAPMRESEGD